MRYSRLFKFLFIFLLSIGMAACEEEKDDGPDDFPPLDTGPTQVDEMVVIFTQSTSNANVYVDSAVIRDLDGPGGNPPQIIDSLQLLWFDSFNNYVSYNARIKFFNNGRRVDSIITNNAQDFIICFRDFQTQELLRVRSNQDIDGFDLGTTSDWVTDGGPSNTSGVNEIRITLNYQPLRKNGLCDAGVLIFDADLPYRLI